MLDAILFGSKPNQRFRFLRTLTSFLIEILFLKMDSSQVIFLLTTSIFLFLCLFFY